MEEEEQEENGELEFEDPFSVKFRGIGDEIVFRSFEQVKAWAEEEIASWAWVESNHTYGPQLASDLTQKLIAPWRNVARNCDTALGNREDEEVVGDAEVEILNEIRDFEYEEHLSAKSRPGGAISKIAEKEPMHALARLIAATNVTVPVSMQNGLLNIRPILEEIGRVQSRGAAEISELREGLEHLRDVFGREFRETAEKQKLAKKIALNAGRTHEGQLGTFREEFEQQKVQHYDRMTVIEDNFTEQMRLKSAVEYWGEKEQFHADEAGVARQGFNETVFLVLAVIGTAILLYFGTDLFDGKVFGGKPIWENPGLLFGAGGPALLAIWYLRIKGRDIIRHESLADDARERIAMTKTFLALEYKGVASDDQRLLVLHNLFRPSTVAQDDTAPATIFDLLFKRK
jgi:hypothetical protein